MEISLHRLQPRRCLGSETCRFLKQCWFVSPLLRGPRSSASPRHGFDSRHTQDPEELIPVGVTEGYCKSLTEMYAGNRGVTMLDSTAMARFPSLEILWLNDNKLTKLKGIEANFRIKHLFLHNNAIATVCNASCCLLQLRHLETLQLANNQLQDLKSTLGVISQLPFLKKLQLAGNPLEAEASYRDAIIFAVPTLEQLDSAMVTPFERAAAVKFFTAKRIEKPIAFGTIPKIWDKPRKIAIGERSEGERILGIEIAASTRRRTHDAELRRVLEDRQRQNPSFEMRIAKASSSLLSAQCGRPALDAASFAFVARGRVPQLLLRLGDLGLMPQAQEAAESVGGAGATVYIAATCLDLQRSPWRTESVHPAQFAGGVRARVRAEDGGRFEAFLFPTEVYAKAYDKVLTQLQAGMPETLCVNIALRESTTHTPIASAKLPLALLLSATATEKEFRFDATPLLPPHASSHDATPAPLATLDASIVTDWGLANTSAAEYGNSRFGFLERRRPPAEPLPADPPMVHLSRDRFCVTIRSSNAAAAPAAEASVPPLGGSIRFDATKYAEFERVKAMGMPTTTMRETHKL